MATKGIERREATPQFISNFEVCENHSFRAPNGDIGEASIACRDGFGVEWGAIFAGGVAEVFEPCPCEFGLVIGEGVD